MKANKYAILFIAASLGISSAGKVRAEPQLQEARNYPAPELIARSKNFSSQMTIEHPETGVILKKLGLKYLHELDPNLVYQLNTRTGDVRTLTREQSAAGGSVGPAAIFWGFGTPTVRISGGAAINGEAATTVTCPFSAQTAEVSGFMASTVSRDPIAGIRNGVLVVDDPLTSRAQANFTILRASGGARNPINRTVLESLHTGSCGDEVRINNLVTTWPPIRVELTIDDTGSMGTQLSGVKTAIASFIGNTNTGEDQRAVSYELISFKDSPTLRLANTEDTSAVISAVQALSASGGDDCPEDSLGALGLALSRIDADEDSEGSVILATDASPGTGNVDALIAQARASGTRVNVLLSGDCVAGAATKSRAINGNTDVIPAATLSSREVFSRLAKDTGGLYFYAPGATAEVYSDLLGQIFSSVAEGITPIKSDELVEGIKGDAGEDHLYRLDVPAGAKLLRVMSYGGTGNISLFMKRESIPNETDYESRSARPSTNSQTMQVDNPVAGTYYIRLSGVSAYSKVALRALVRN
ncbi:pre-peptidase C-terminal domain-containing protein [Xanthomonas cucurbitae]|uniref:pre-peptidase C-terminal domain-containing protein n=1 Tax=Xanthomonas cucurbitae TaxID=56453 RepID=UPI003EBE0DA3